MLPKHWLSTYTVTQNTCKITHQFNCSKKHLVNLFTCNKCFKQYVGQTVDEFGRRWNNYKSNDRKFQRLEPCMQEQLLSHFSMAGQDGFLNDVSIILTRLVYLILYGEEITGDKRLKQWFHLGLILKIESDGCFSAYFFTW